MSQNEVVGGLADGKSEDQSFFLKEMIAELTKAKKCREYTNARLREFPRKTNRRDFRRANADRFTSVKRLWRPKKISYTEPRIRRRRPSSDRSECR